MESPLFNLAGLIVSPAPLVPSRVSSRLVSYLALMVVLFTQVDLKLVGPIAERYCELLAEEVAEELSVARVEPHLMKRVVVVPFRATAETG